MTFIPMANPLIGEEEARAAYDQVKSGWISMGNRVAQFEKQVSDYVGVKHAIAMNNGTATHHAALLALGVTRGDDVLVPALSYISSANTVVLCGANPVFVEENSKTFNVDAEEIARRITPRTKVIMTVDLKGQSVDYGEILKIARSKGIPVLADSAESFGAMYNEEIVGSQANIHSFSLFANKNITTGEGGLVTTNDDQIADICRCIRNQGQSERYVHVRIGHNYRMTDVIAAIGIEQLKKIDWILETKGNIADFYTAAFRNSALVTPPFLPPFATRHSWYMYCVTVDERVDRDRMLEKMKALGVDSRLSFPPIPLQPVYRELYGFKDGDFPRAERIFSRFLDIPCWAGMTDRQMQTVVDVVTEAAEYAAA